MKLHYAYSVSETRLYYRIGSDPVEKRRIIPCSLDVTRIQALSTCCDFALAVRDHDLVVGSDEYQIVEVTSGFIAFAYVSGAVVASYRYQISRRIVTE